MFSYERKVSEFDDYGLICDLVRLAAKGVDAIGPVHVGQRGGQCGGGAAARGPPAPGRGR